MCIANNIRVFAGDDTRLECSIFPRILYHLWNLLHNPSAKGIMVLSMQITK
jgi:hypothetical protein